MMKRVLQPALESTTYPANSAMRIVIHFTLASAIADELPSLLTGKTPPNPKSSLGTRNWSEPPRALLLGGAYQQEDIERLQKVANGTEGAAVIPWLRVDSTKGKPPPSIASSDDHIRKAYASAIVHRLKAKLNELHAEGKLQVGQGGIYLV